MSLPQSESRSLMPLLAALALAIGACGEDAKPASDTTDTADTADTSPDTTNDTASCEGRAGVADCPCRTDRTCDTGLACVDGVCVAEVTTGLVLPAGARGCEVLLLEGGGRVGEVRFAAGVRGTFVREAPRVAIAVIRESDADFPSGAVEVLGTGSPVATVAEARCVDAAGAGIPNAVVTLR